MIHPHTELRFIDPEMGFGVFATAFIPKGTIMYVPDALEITIKAHDPKLTDPLYRPVIERYAQMTPDGSRVISWDIARYVNHCCCPNTLGTGYDFEVAIQDIEAGEEITDEYGLFEFELSMPLRCVKAGCRHALSPTDLDQYAEQWDKQIQAVLPFVITVAQPLLPYHPHTDLWSGLQHYLQTGEGYPSVRGLKPIS